MATGLLEISDIINVYNQLTEGMRSLSERVDYLTVAANRGDPRFAKEEYANSSFDCTAFDAWWASKGKRVPTAEEVFG